MTKEEYNELFRKTEGKLFDYKNIIAQWREKRLLR